MSKVDSSLPPSHFHRSSSVPTSRKAEASSNDRTSANDRKRSSSVTPFTLNNGSGSFALYNSQGQLTLKGKEYVSQVTQQDDEQNAEWWDTLDEGNPEEVKKTINEIYEYTVERHGELNHEILDKLAPWANSEDSEIKDKIIKIVYHQVEVMKCHNAEDLPVKFRNFSCIKSLKK